mmetsp:Transcript_44808/g.136805  ORF Transcript_44808/g.136805 Transcript_44808/m.136805 type:complete len:221 (-) Transcript_44808:3985-4647(-)
MSILPRPCIRVLPLWRLPSRTELSLAEGGQDDSLYRGNGLRLGPIPPDILAALHSRKSCGQINRALSGATKARGEPLGSLHASLRSELEAVVRQPNPKIFLVRILQRAGVRRQSRRQGAFARGEDVREFAIAAPFAAFVSTFLKRKAEMVIGRAQHPSFRVITLSAFYVRQNDSGPRVAAIALPLTPGVHLPGSRRSSVQLDIFQRPGRTSCARIWRCKS